MVVLYSPQHIFLVICPTCKASHRFIASFIFILYHVIGQPEICLDVSFISSNRTSSVSPLSPHRSAESRTYRLTLPKTRTCILGVKGNRVKECLKETGEVEYDKMRPRAGLYLSEKESKKERREPGFRKVGRLTKAREKRNSARKNT